MSLSVEHSMLEELRRIDAEAARRFPTRFDPGLGGVGLILSRDLSNGGYVETPMNSAAFAWTGCEGVHFSFVVRDGRVDERSPVIVTIPMAFPSDNLVVGESLYEFLCLGVYRGYNALEQLGYRYDEVVEVYSDTEWRPKTRRHECVGYRVSEHQRVVLGFLREELDLVPWRDVRGRLADLGAKYKDLLEMSEEYPL
jgi:hypothetical protein